MANYVEFPTRDDCTDLFNAIDLNGDGGLTLREIRKALRKNKALKTRVAHAPALAPLLIPRLFHETAEALDRNRDGWITLQEFSRFCAAVSLRKNVESEALVLAKILPKGLKRCDLPVEIYRIERAVEFILNQAKLLMPMMSPLAFKRGLVDFITEEGVDVKKEVEDEEELIRICARVVMLSDVDPPESLEELLGRRIFPEYDAFQVEPINATAEEFSIMGMDEMGAGNPQSAIRYYQLSTQLDSTNKVYHLALGEACLANGDFDAAILAFSHAMAVAPRWPAAMEAYIKAHDAKKRQEELEREQENKLQAESYGRRLA